MFRIFGYIPTIYNFQFTFLYKKEPPANQNLWFNFSFSCVIFSTVGFRSCSEMCVYPSQDVSPQNNAIQSIHNIQLFISHVMMKMICWFASKTWIWIKMRCGGSGGKALPATTTCVGTLFSIDGGDGGGGGGR